MDVVATTIVEETGKIILACGLSCCLSAVADAAIIGLEMAVDVVETVVCGSSYCLSSAVDAEELPISPPMSSIGRPLETICAVLALIFFSSGWAWDTNTAAHSSKDSMRSRFILIVIVLIRMDVVHRV